jgi:predicted phosphodiesterase
MTQAEQIVTATDVLINRLDLWSKVGKVSYAPIVGGNHDRLQGNFREAIPLNNAATIINASLNRVAPDNKMEVRSVSDKLTIVKINGKRIGLMHGDGIKKKDKNLKEQIERSYGVKIDLLLTGHYHTYTHKHGHISCPSMFGATEYSVAMGYNEPPGALYIVMEEDGTMHVFPIFVK